MMTVVAQATIDRDTQEPEELFPSRDFEHALGILPPPGCPLDLLRVATMVSAKFGRLLKKTIMMPKCTQCDNLIQ
jgi:hypothetical protein